MPTFFQSMRALVSAVFEKPKPAAKPVLTEEQKAVATEEERFQRVAKSGAEQGLSYEAMRRHFHDQQIKKGN